MASTNLSLVLDFVMKKMNTNRNDCGEVVSLAEVRAMIRKGDSVELYDENPTDGDWSYKVFKVALKSKKRK